MVNVLKQWIQLCWLQDFDDKLIAKLFDFINGTLHETYPALEEKLSKAVKAQRVRS